MVVRCRDRPVTVVHGETIVAASRFNRHMSAVTPVFRDAPCDRLVPTLPRSRESQFWLLQAVGWIGFGALMFLWGLTHLPPGVALVNKLILVLLGVTASLGLRSVFSRARRHSWSVRRIVAVSLGATAVLAVVWSELHLMLFEGLMAMNAGRSVSLTWIDLYPGTVLTNLLVLNAWCLGYFGVHAWIALDRERERARIAELRAHEARLCALQSQLEPHFLFNALNAVSTLVAERRNREAQQMLSQLAEFLRRTLDAATTPEVRVATEVDLARQYVDIQSVRFGDRLRVRFEIEPDVVDAAVPVLILQPIIENAVVHGVLSRERGGTIDIFIRREGSRLLLGVSDDGPGREPGRGDGHGLANTSNRLLELYGDDHSLTLSARTGGGTSAVIEIPFRLVARVTAMSESGRPR